jgi:DNA-binding transcriptional LysR family regulator
MSLPLRALNLNLLVALDALLDERSVTRAASRAGVTQSAMSQSLAQLREIFDDALLVRVRGGMEPTPRALRVAPQLRRALNDLQRVIDADDEFEPATATARFRVSSIDIGGFYFLPDLRRALDREAPGIDVDLVAPRKHSGDALAGGEIDFAIDVEANARGPGLDSALFTDGEQAVLVREEHPGISASARKIPMAVYTATPHLVIGTGDAVLSNVARGLAERGVERTVGMRVPYFLLAPWVLLESDLVWTCPRAVAERLAARLPLRVLKPPFPLPRERIHLVWHKRNSDEPAHVWMRERILRAAHSPRAPVRAPRGGRSHRSR